MGIEYEDMRVILEATRTLERREKLLVLGDAVVHFTGAGLTQLATETGATLAATPDAQLDSFALGRALSLLRFRNTVTRSDEPGNVYLNESRLNRIRFGPAMRSPRESNFIPNNVVAVLAFQKLRDADAVSPQRSSPYEATR